MEASVLSQATHTGTPRMVRVIRAHEIVDQAANELRLDGLDGGEAVCFLALAVAVHLKFALGTQGGRAAMLRAIDYASLGEGA